VNALGAAQQAIELVENADAAADKGGGGGAGDAEAWEGAQAEDEAGVENEIDDVGNPEQAHGDGGVAGTAEDGVVEKEHENGATATERDARVAGTGGHDLRRSAHDPQEVWGVEAAGHADEERGGEAENDGLHTGDGGVPGIFFADATGDHGGGGHTEAEADGDDQA